MKKYLLKINPEALSDIREIANWYDEQKAGLGSRFQNTVIKQIDLLTEDLNYLQSVTKKSDACWLRNFHTWFIFTSITKLSPSKFLQ